MTRCPIGDCPELMPQGDEDCGRHHHKKGYCQAPGCDKQLPEYSPPHTKWCMAHRKTGKAKADKAYKDRIKEIERAAKLESVARQKRLRPVAEPDTPAEARALIRRILDADRERLIKSVKVFTPGEIAAIVARGEVTHISKISNMHYRGNEGLMHP